MAGEKLTEAIRVLRDGATCYLDARHAIASALEELDGRTRGEVGERCGSCGRRATHQDPHNDGDAPVEYCHVCFSYEEDLCELKQRAEAAEERAASAENKAQLYEELSDAGRRAATRMESERNEARARVTELERRYDCAKSDRLELIRELEAARARVGELEAGLRGVADGLDSLERAELLEQFFGEPVPDEAFGGFPRRFAKNVGELLEPTPSAPTPAVVDSPTSHIPVELKRRTPGEMRAYADGIEAAQKVHPAHAMLAAQSVREAATAAEKESPPRDSAAEVAPPGLTPEEAEDGHLLPAHRELERIWDEADDPDDFHPHRTAKEALWLAGYERGHSEGAQAAKAKGAKVAERVRALTPLVTNKLAAFNARDVFQRNDFRTLAAELVEDLAAELEGAK